MVSKHTLKVKYSVLCSTGMYSRDITNTIFVILHSNVSHLSVCSACKLCIQVGTGLIGLAKSTFPAFFMVSEEQCFLCCLSSVHYAEYLNLIDSLFASWQLCYWLCNLSWLASPVPFWHYL